MTDPPTTTLPTRLGDRIPAIRQAAELRDAEEDATGAAAADIVALAEQHFELLRSTDGQLLAVPRSEDAPRVVREVKSLRPELVRRVRRERDKVPSAAAMSAAMEALAGEAADAPVQPVHVRSATVDDGLWIDLANTDGDLVHVYRDGWDVVRGADRRNAPLFRRTPATRELVSPAPGGSRDELRELLGLDASDPRWLRIWGWLVAAYFEAIPRPVLWVLGPQGSGKSTRARMALSVVEPTDALGREPGRNERDDTVAAAGRFLPSWDNIGSVSAATSDWLCRLVTGVEVGSRALYTDDDLRLTTIRRSGVATSIVLPFGLGADALERLVLVPLERVTDEQRLPEADLWRAFDAARCRILGAVLDDVAGVLWAMPRAMVDDRPLPRMADYARVLRALDHTSDGLDDEELSFEAAYTSAVNSSLADRAHEDPLTAAILRFLDAHGGAWEGLSAALSEALNELRPDGLFKGWPSTPAALGRALQANSETLRAVGVEAGMNRSHGVRRRFLRRVQ